MAYSVAYAAFLERKREVERLITLARLSEPVVHPPTASISKKKILNAQTASHLCRAGVVLLCSHIEGFIEETVELAIDKIYDHSVKKEQLAMQFRYYFSKDIISAIKASIDPVSISRNTTELFSRDAWLWDEAPNFSKALDYQTFVNDFATPNFDGISKLWKRFGYEAYPQDMARNLQQNFPACKNMIDQVVVQRNKIAHGDAVVTATAKDLSDMLNLVTLFCRANDRVVCNWFASVGCFLRARKLRRVAAENQA